MGILGSIFEKFRQHGNASAAGNAAPAQTQSAPQPQGQAQQSQGATAPLQNVDIDKVLSDLAAKKGGGNYRESIVDLLKLLDLDSSLAARKELANELNVRAGADGSAEQNIALHQAVMAKVAANGGRVPDTMRH